MNWKIASLVNAFKAPRDTLGPLDPDAAATLITAASDVALIVDADGVIRDIAFNSERLALDLDGSEFWVGQRWVDVVTIESRAKVEAMLRPNAASGPPCWRHVNHATSRNAFVPVLYSTVQLA